MLKILQLPLAPKIAVMLAIPRIIQLPLALKIAFMLAIHRILQLPLELWRNDESSASACKSPYISYA